MWCDKLWMGVFSWQRKLCTSLLLDWSLVSTGQCSHVFFCQSSGSGCSPNSSTHCSVQGRICPCKNGSMDTFTILYHMCFPKVKRSPIVSTKQWSFVSGTWRRAPLAMGTRRTQKKRSSFQQWVHQNSLWAHGCMVNPFQVSVQDLKKPEVTQNRVPSKAICSIVCHILASRHHDSLSFVRRWFSSDLLLEAIGQNIKKLTNCCSWTAQFRVYIHNVSWALSDFGTDQRPSEGWAVPRYIVTVKWVQWFDVTHGMKHHQWFLDLVPCLVSEVEFDPHQGLKRSIHFQKTRHKTPSHCGKAEANHWTATGC